MVFFKKEAIEFLENLRDNNTKEWFLDHRDEYEELILEPSKRFVEEMGEELCALVPNIKAIPKINGSLFRIYRDIRLSRDKTPMKSRIGIVFWRGSGKRLQSSSFYIHFSPDELLVASGIRGFSKDSLDGFREYIKCEKNASNLTKILDDIKSKGYKLPDPKYKRYPRGFDKDDEFSDLALYGSMFAYKSLDPKFIYSDELTDTLFKIYHDLLPLFEWIYDMSLTFDIKDPNGKSLSL
jgi:uncharacterized protein (TIGR02453 family)